ncbi:MAG: FAD-binding oxidoreductase [Candidatus Woesebacteria bacterium]|jgi:CDP-4-dehydro-6-deoxyglucose reductase
MNENPTEPAVQTYTAILEDKQVYNEKFTHYSFELKNPHRLEFKAGQYVSFLISADGLRRSYSIISTPDIQHGFEILVEPIAGGKGTAYLESLNFGDEVSVLAPLGQFTIANTQDERNLAFVATGVGVAPMRSMILDLLRNKQDSREMMLYWGLRYATDMIWQDEFLNISKTFANFHFHPVISRPVKEWTLCRGRVTDCLNVHQLTENTAYYICGSEQMVQDVIKVLKAKGVEDKWMHFEKFN